MTLKFLTFSHEGQPHLGCLLADDTVLDLTEAWRRHAPQGSDAAPSHVGELIGMGDAGLDTARKLMEAADGRSQRLSMQDISLLAPIPRPVKNVFCVGRNYREHIIEGNLARGRDPHDFPTALEFFTKPPTAVVGHRAVVSRHADWTDMLDYEVELGIVIGKRGADIPRERALEHVFGYTIVNDVTARDLQARHGQWFKGKSLDTTCPIGPVVAHHSAIADPNALDLDLRINGEVRQQANTSSMLFDVSGIIEQLSRGLTLEPGDIIATGTPSGVGFAMQPPRCLQPGDVMTACIAGIGTLENVIQ